MEIALYFPYEVQVSREAAAERAAANPLPVTHHT
jgi:hypothetical protein